MLQVGQTVTGRNGNCYQACVASVLELSLAEVPSRDATDTAERYVERLREWLQPRGLTLVSSDLAAHRASEFTPSVFFPQGYWIASLPTGSGDFAHAVVMRGLDVAWNPHPPPHPWERCPPHDPVINGFTHFVALDPARVRLD
jgi:hypothetical protein